MVHKTSFHLLSLGMIIMLGCEKDNIDNCKGCGYDYSFKEFEFQIEGKLLSDCTGDPAAFKLLDFNLYYNAVDSFIGSTNTDANGNFSFTYKKVLPGTYWQNADWISVLRLFVKQDSVVYYLNGVANITDLNLILHDSINIDVSLNNEGLPLGPTDAIMYWFGSDKLLDDSQIFTAVGPIDDNAIVRTFQGPWKHITISNRKPVLRLYWKVRRDNSWITSLGFTALASKESCVIRKDSVVIEM